MRVDIYDKLSVLPVFQQVIGVAGFLKGLVSLVVVDPFKKVANCFIKMEANRFKIDAKEDLKTLGLGLVRATPGVGTIFSAVVWGVSSYQDKKVLGKLYSNLDDVDVEDTENETLNKAKDTANNAMEKLKLKLDKENISFEGGEEIYNISLDENIFWKMSLTITAKDNSKQHIEYNFQDKYKAWPPESLQKDIEQTIKTIETPPNEEEFNKNLAFYLWALAVLNR